ncbi:uncharacterized protein LOC122505589 [Leptopilina heterotoma]|uniref:uncharacterized protein LOC122505589 n=1 Tax=Leptopilina heterotoma TaxID=63436 RepID=UPI001CA93A59|nr:uncharacterized protein LOC122505589 [Leptopilina heterotoma]
MLRVISLLFVFIAVSNAEERKVTFTSGNIIQGKFAEGVKITKNKQGQQEIEWNEEFGSKNPLTVYLSHIYEDTSVLEVVEVSDLCANYETGSFQDTVKYFFLRKFRGTNRCPVKKGKNVIKYPMINSYEAKKGAVTCGPIITTMHVVKNKNPKTGEAPLLFTAQLRGAISGANC